MLRTFFLFCQKKRRSVQEPWKPCCASSHASCMANASSLRWTVIYYVVLLLQSTAAWFTVIAARWPPCPSSPILCHAILLNGVHLCDCYRDVPLRPACCRYSLVSRSRQVMSPVGRFYVLSQMFEIGSWNDFSLRFLFSYSRQKRKRSTCTCTLSSTSSTCGSFRFCVSVISWCAISIVAWCNWCLRKQHEPIDTIWRKQKCRISTCQTTRRSTLFCDERGCPHKPELRFRWRTGGPYRDRKSWTFIFYWRYSTFVHLRCYLKRMRTLVHW